MGDIIFHKVLDCQMKDRNFWKNAYNMEMSNGKAGINLLKVLLLLTIVLKDPLRLHINISNTKKTLVKLSAIQETGSKRRTTKIL